jgi:hypothetical protein
VDIYITGYISLEVLFALQTSHLLNNGCPTSKFGRLVLINCATPSMMQIFALGIKKADVKSWRGSTF